MIAVNALEFCICAGISIKNIIQTSLLLEMIESSQVTFIYIALLTIQIVSKKLHNIKIGK